MAKNPASPPRQRGSIRPRGTSFQVRVYAGTNPETGEPHYLSETCTDEKEAEKARIRLLAQVDARKAPLSNSSFAAVVERWLETRETEVASGDLSEATLADYRQLARDHVIPVLGAVTMNELDRQLVPATEGLYGRLTKCKLRCGGRMKIEHSPGGRGNNRVLRRDELEGHTCGRRCKPHVCVRMSASRLRAIHAVISGTCAMAFRWRWIQDNPAERIKPPKAPAPRPQSLPPQTVGRLLQAAFDEDPDWGTVNWLLLVTGARRGEIARVQIKHVDFRRRMVFIDSTKVDGTARWVALDEFTMQLLEAMVGRIAARLAAAGLAVTGEEFLYSYRPDHSEPGSLGYFSHRFGKMAKALGIDAHPHLYRNFSATELIAGGMDMVSVSRRIGHTRVSTTSDIYAAWKPEVDVRAVDILTSGLALPMVPEHNRPERDRSAEQPNRTAPELEERICGLRRRTGWGPKRIREHLAAEEITVAESTIWKVLQRNGVAAEEETATSS